MNGIECLECSVISEGFKAFDECPNCGEDNTIDVAIAPCPNNAGQSGDCDDPDHHWGRGDHVRNIES